VPERVSRAIALSGDTDDLESVVQPRIMASASRQAGSRAAPETPM
jgi:hypothetical protein